MQTLSQPPAAASAKPLAPTAFAPTEQCGAALLTPKLLDARGRRNRVLADRVCEFCGVVFRPPRWASRFCSLRCLNTNSARNRQYPSVEERFWAKVDKRGPDDCWPWTAARNPKGYGLLGIGGKNVAATRVSWSIHHGQPWPKDKIACHSCDNPTCVNPAHIWPGTVAENQRDMAVKGRSRFSGAHCPNGHEYADQKQFASDILANRRRCRKCARESEQRRIAAIPVWARNNEARLLLSLIAEEQPERTRVLTRTLGGTAADFGFAGRNASKLRAIFARTYGSLMDWASAAETREGFDARRDAVIAYAEQFGADALIARVVAS